MLGSITTISGALLAMRLLKRKRQAEEQRAEIEAARERLAGEFRPPASRDATESTE